LSGSNARQVARDAERAAFVTGGVADRQPGAGWFPCRRGWRTEGSKVRHMYIGGGAVLIIVIVVVILLLRR